jgi:type IV pilus assembly protein PilC
MAKEKKLTGRIIPQIYSGLVRLLESGLKPVEALRKLGLEDDRLAPLFSTAADAIEEGEPLSKALEKGAPGLFPERDLAMLDAAELTDSHSETLERLMTDHRRRSATVRRFLKRTLYPAILVHFAALVCVVAMIARDSAGESTALAWVGLAIALVPFYVGLACGWHLYTRYWKGPGPRDEVASFPFIMAIFRQSELGNFFRLLYTLYGAGIQLDKAANQAASLIRTDSIRGRVFRAIAPLAKKEPFSACLKEFGLPDETFSTRLAIGEESGNLEEAFRETAEELTERAQARATALLTRISILVTLLAYLGVAAIIVGFYIHRYGGTL